MGNRVVAGALQISSPLHVRNASGSQQTWDHSSGVGGAITFDLNGNFKLSQTGTRLGIGLGTTTGADYTVAIGNGANASGIASIAHGYYAVAAGVYGIAIGDQCSAGAQSTIAMGFGANASGTYAIAMGESAAASATTAMSIGVNSAASGNYSIAHGYGAVATGSDAIALGRAASAAAGEFALGATITKFCLPSAPTVPATAGAAGRVGQTAWDANYFYLCVAASTWKRVALATW